jgi:hypothetical protein
VDMVLQYAGYSRRSLRQSRAKRRVSKDGLSAGTAYVYEFSTSVREHCRVVEVDESATEHQQAGLSLYFEMT